MSSESEAIAWLRELPAESEISWCSNHLTEQEPYATGWIDLSCPQLEEVVNWNWTWTIERFDREHGSDDPFSISHHYDSQLEIQLDEEDLWPTVVRLRLPSNELVDLSSIVNRDAEWQRDYWRDLTTTEPLEFDGAVHPAQTRCEEIDGMRWYVSAVWSADGVNDALGHWAREVVGRDDLHFRWDPSLPGSRFHRQAAEVLARYQAGELDAVQIGDGVMAVGGTFDFLLSLPPEEAAEITGQLQEMRDRLLASWPDNEDAEDE